MKNNLENWLNGWKEVNNIFFSKRKEQKELQNNAMVLFGFNNYEEFSNQLDIDLAFRHFVYDFLKEKLVE
jgi:hypothetical protein